MSEPSRIKTIKSELDKCMKEYLVAKEKLECARVEFEAAKERFGSVRRFGAEVLTDHDMSHWTWNHPQVRYVGLPIGDAITAVLIAHAYNYLDNRNEAYTPAMELEEIADELENGGFEFRSVSPLREVNAALIHLKGITKIEEKDEQYWGAPTMYQLDDSHEIMKKVKEKEEKEDKEAKELEKPVVETASAGGKKKK